MLKIKQEDAIMFLDKKEICREYVSTDKIKFGTSTLHPGQTGGIDPGHPFSKEIFYAAKGSVIIRNPNTNTCHTLMEGDAIIIEEGEPHELTNIGENIAIITWSCAPNPG